MLHQITSSLTSLGSIWSFVSHIQETSKCVVSITAGLVTNTIAGQKGSVVEIVNWKSKVPDPVTHAIVGLAAGSFISNSERLNSTTVAVEE